MPIINKRNHQENSVQSENNNNDVATIQRTEEEIPEDEFQEISLDSLDDNNADEYPNLMSSATFG